MNRFLPLFLLPFALSAMAIGPCANDPIGSVNRDAGGTGSGGSAGGSNGGGKGGGNGDRDAGAGSACQGDNPAQACRSANSCLPSACGCDQTSGGWICTADCGGGRDCSGGTGGNPGGTVDAGTCGPTCTIFCQFGNVLDASGCPTCKCKPNPDPVPPCPPVCEIFCEYGNVPDATTGCPTCACNPPPKPPMCGGVCAIFCEYGNVLDASGCPTCRCNPPPANNTCPADKCTGPMPKSANYVCPDNRTIAGPACTVDAAGACSWTIVTCP